MFPQNDIYTKDHYMRGIVEFGKVTTIDSKNANCTVTFPDRNYQSGPLKWIHRSCLGAQHYDMPTEGDTAVVLHSGIARERGVILGFVYTNGNPPPWTDKTWRGVLYSDNSYIVYDQGQKNWIINLQGKITLTTVSDVGYTIGGAFNVKTTANTNVNGVIIDPSGNVTIPGTLTVGGVCNFNAGGNAAPSIINKDGSGGGS